jgi:hypothetical protein
LRYERALDFGRLTQALCRYFNATVGIDIAPTMIDLAQRHNQFPRTCTYFSTVDDSLAMFEAGSFDFVYTRRYWPGIRNAVVPPGRSTRRNSASSNRAVAGASRRARLRVRERSNS